MHSILLASLAVGMAAVNGGDIQKQHRLVYSRPGSRNLALDLYLPPEADGAARPAVLLVHGGGWVFGTRHQLHWYGRRLAENGYVAAAITYRMMPRFPFPACLHDCKAAVRWLREHAGEYGIDPNRIGVLGNSAGGHLASLLALTTPEDGLEGPENPGPSSAVQTVVNFYGVADLNYYRDPHGYIRLGGLTKVFMGRFVGDDGQCDPNPYDRASPAHYAHAECCPMLFLHGLKDNQVPYAQARAFHDQLARLGVPTRFITVPYGHAFDFFHPAARRALFPEVLEFLDNNLKHP